jgi:hypothetical protein
VLGTVILLSVASLQGRSHNFWLRACTCIHCLIHVRFENFIQIFTLCKWHTVVVNDSVNILRDRIISLHNKCIACHLQYILTPSVRRNLCDLVRIVSIGRHPVLLQGETSVGKTSLITYLAKASGNLCVRINNHEHTDLQEYIGSYSADEQGHLVFREGR